MTIIKPFKAIRPSANLAKEISCPPYDVINRSEAKELAKASPYSYLRITRSEVDFDDTVDPYSDAVYERAKENLDKYLSEKILLQEEKPCFFVYKQTMGNHSQVGLVACTSVDEYEQGKIKIHEKTRVDKENDRTRHMLTTKCHCEPVFLTFKSNDIINKTISEVTLSKPLYNITTEDGVLHVLWKMPTNQNLIDEFAKITYSYIADGHHRAASSFRCREALKKENPHHTGNEKYNFFMSVLFPHNELQILPYNRIIHNCKKNADTILNEIRAACEISETDLNAPSERHTCLFYLNGKWYQIKLLNSKTVDLNSVDSLDVSLLYNQILHPIFDIQDQRTDKNIDFVGGIKRQEELQAFVDRGEAVCAFLMHPVSIEEVISIADNNLIMPPKSTWFEPKLRSGLFAHKFEVAF